MRNYLFEFFTLIVQVDRRRAPPTSCQIIIAPAAAAAAAAVVDVYLRLNAATCSSFCRLGSSHLISALIWLKIICFEKASPLESM